LTATAVVFSQQLGTCVGHPPAGNGRPDRANGPSQADEERAPRGQVSVAILPDAIGLRVIMRDALTVQLPRHDEGERGRPGAAPMKQLHNVR
jgi:hypothetical protein